MPVRFPRDRRLLFAVTALSLLAALAVAHLQVLRRGPGYSGVLLLADHAFDLTVVLLLLVCCTAAGLRLLPRLKAELTHPIELLVFSAALGAGLAAISFLVLGLLGGLHLLSLWLVLILLAALAHRQLLQLPTLCARAAAALRSRESDPAFSLFGLAVLAAAVVFMATIALAPPTDWDALMYHLRIPHQYLEAGRIYLPVDNLHTSSIGLMHMLYLPLLAVGSSSGPAILNAVMAALLALAVFAFCLRLSDDRAGHLSVALLWGTTTVLLVAMTPRVDVSLALYLFLAHYALLLSLSEPGTRNRYYLAALLLGLATGVKLSALPYVAGLAPLIVWAAVSKAESPSRAARRLALFGIILAAVSLPVLVKNWLLLGAPLYPFLAKPMLQPWLVPLFGSSSWPARISPDITQFIWELRAPFNLRDAFLAPGRLTIEVEGAYYYLSPAFVLLPIWLLYVKNRTLSWLVIPALIYLIIVLVIFPSPNLRYLIPVAAPLTIVVVQGALNLARRLLSPPALRLLLVASAAIALLPSARAVYVWLTRTQALGYLAGSASGEQYIASRIGSAYVQTFELANERLGDESRILMLFDARGYYFEPDVLQDNNGTNWPLLASVLEPGDCLGSAGVTHVLLGLGALRYYVAAGLDPERIRWRAFQQFAARCLDPLLDNGALVLFRVKRPGVADAGEPRRDAAQDESR